MDQNGSGDTIIIRNLSLMGIIGIFPEERVNKQRIIINAELSCDLTKAGSSDDLNDTVNYKDIIDEIKKLVATSSFNLVEKLAEEISCICLSSRLIRMAKISVLKPDIIEETESVGVEITRFNDLPQRSNI